MKLSSSLTFCIPFYLSSKRNMKHLTDLLQEIAPYTGFGTLEDSKQSCDTLIPQPPKKDFIKMMENDGLMLRYEAVMVCAARRPILLTKCF